MNRNIFLIGLMGSGKTTIGRALARKLDKRFFDADHEIEARTGASVALIFEIEGEAVFRQREAEVIRDLCAHDDIVLATGGGAVLDANSRHVLAQRGTVIYLRASVNSILQRTSHDKSRPLLQTADPRRRIEDLSRQREPYYQEIADIVIDTGRPNVSLLVQTICAQLDALPLKPSGNSMHSEASTSSEIIADAATDQSATVTMQVDLKERSYPIYIGTQLLDNVALMQQCLSAQRVAIVTNTVVAPLYLARLHATLAAAGKQVIDIILPDGEEEKNWAGLMRIFDSLLEHKCDRKTTLIALGGGVVGDMTGFAAASYMRGIAFIQIPTTLLAQVDSSVGGKTGINHPLGKNMIGAFYQPQAVLADIETLHTLPVRELSAGLAEVIKYGAVIDTTFFEWLEQNIAQLMAREATALVHAIQRCCEIKADVVRQDEREGGMRAILNFGHTFGHAIEAGMGYGAWLHGEAVGCGMVMAADLSCRMGFIDTHQRDRVTTLVTRAGLPTTPPDLGLSRWIELMQVDKKSEDGQIKFILMKPLGSACIMAVPADLLASTIDHCVRQSV